MKKVDMIEEFNTSFGKIFIIENNIPLKIGETVDVNGKNYNIKRIILPTTPIDRNIVSIVVE